VPWTVILILVVALNFWVPATVTILPNMMIK
jgi:hypothetical protein